MIYFVFSLVFKVKVVNILDVNIISASPRNPLDIMTDVFGHIVNNFEEKKITNWAVAIWNRDSASGI